MSKTDAIDTSTPAGSDNPRQGDDNIRELKRAIVEAMNVDHTMGTPTGSAYDSDDAGKHSKITLSAAQTIAELANGSIARDSNGELWYKDSSGNMKQLTNAGQLNVLDADGAVMKTGNQTIAGVKTFSSAPVLSAGANAGSQLITNVLDPVSAQDAATKEYVDDQISAIGSLFGSWKSKNFNQQYTAETDGFVVGYSYDSSLTAKTPAGTTRMWFDLYHSGSSSCICMPVKKGDTWKVVKTSGTNNALYWLPMGS